MTATYLQTAIEDAAAGALDQAPPATPAPLPIEGYRSDPTGDRCATGPTPGARALVRELGSRFGGRGEIFNCRPVRGGRRLSLHAEGRAVDWYRNANDPAQLAEAQRICDWLLGTDADGNQHALARRMGIQEIIWNRRIWTARRHAEGWRAYTGASPHTDHLHIGLNREGAAMRTSHWRGHAAAPVPAQAAAAEAPHPVVPDAVDAVVAQELQTGSGLSATANAIMAYQGSGRPGRLQTMLNEIVRHYYPGEENKIAQWLWDARVVGLSITYRGSGPTLQGVVTGGDQFLDGMVPLHFARRVLQVGHELRHVDQQRAGMGGPGNRHRREFLAFHWEALTPEKPGTGRMQHSTRVALIDEAIRHYLAMPEAQRRAHTAQYDELLQRRPAEVRASGRNIPVPTIPAP